MRLRHIEVFHAVYTCGSVTAAAQHLNVSQPAVSKVLAHAEQQLGFPLFQRLRGRLVATAEAERLFPRVAELYQHIGEVREAAADLRGPLPGKLRVASTPALGLELVPHLVAGFLTARTGALVEVATKHLDSIVEDLRLARLDVGLAFNPPPLSGLVSRPLAAGPYVLIAPPGSAWLPGDGAPFDLGALSDLPLVELDTRSPLGLLLRERLDALQVRPRVVARAETYHMARSLVAAGLGVAVVDAITAAAATGGEVVTVPLVQPLGFRVALMLREHWQPPPLVEAFIAHCRDHVQSAVTGLGQA